MPQEAKSADRCFPAFPPQESGIHQDGMLKNRETYEIMTPESIGLNRGADEVGVVLGKHSGRNALNSRLKAMGYELTQEVLDEVRNCCFNF